MSDVMERRGPSVEPREIMQEGDAGLVAHSPGDRCGVDGDVGELADRQALIDEAGAFERVKPKLRLSP